ncbi:PepSY domain-containing protein [Methylocystis sp. H62]|uniref:PepSY domain-containing protein n=1 Tax=Methylocystis sp. H62 TaxID=2785789 RepID=UPI0018C29EE3|nr:PepSY domain-containing protein [Methylocystis sp. H62]MBG0792860.1 PepSY domain-containing protein [Methylocystis sp. H62]
MPDLLPLERWLGLTAGTILTLIGLTGSFNMFYRVFDAALNPALYAPTGLQRRVTDVDAMQAVKSRHLDRRNGRRS